MKLINLFDTDGFIPHINEVFDTIIPVDSWTTRGETKVGHLKIDNEDYYILLEPKIFSFNNQSYNFINIAFRKMVNGEESEELTYTNIAGSKVIGAIANAMRTELKKHEYAAIVFVATDNVDKRMAIYNNLTRKFGGDFLSCRPDVPIPGGKMTILFNKNFSAHHKEFEEHLKTSGKI
jgi:hypothetical protein